MLEEKQSPQRPAAKGPGTTSNATGKDAPSTSATASPKRVLTPQQIERMEINRLKAKALREERERQLRQNAPSPGSLAGQKRPAGVPSSQRDARRLKDGETPSTATVISDKPTPSRPLDEIRPARNFTRFVDYDFSKMTDTKGGFLTAEDDPFNKALHSRRGIDGEEKPAHMTQREWERLQALKAMREDRSNPFEFGPEYLKSKEAVRCRECESTEVDWKWWDTFRCAVCNACKDKFPEKYSLLTKTEAREDYLLTEPELKDEELLPHLEKPNPHKATWNNMMLFLRYQVEEHAFSPKKWGSPEGLDAEFERREALRKKQKESKFKTRLLELKKRTLVGSYRRGRKGTPGGNDSGNSGGGGNFGDVVGQGSGRHTHTWGRPVTNPETGMGVKTCVECGMEVEELEF